MRQVIVVQTNVCSRTGVGTVEPARKVFSYSKFSLRSKYTHDKASLKDSNNENGSGSEELASQSDVVLPDASQVLAQNLIGEFDCPKREIGVQRKLKSRLSTSKEGKSPKKRLPGVASKLVMGRYVI